MTKLTESAIEYFSIKSNQGQVTGKVPLVS